VLEAVAASLPAWSAVHVLPLLVQGMGGSMKPVQKEASLKTLATFAKSAPEAVGRVLVDLIPVVSGLIWDARKEVKAAAVVALEAICFCSGNSDIAVFVPQLSHAIQNPESIPETVESLAGCVFVQEVEAAALAITCPVLLRGLGGRTDVMRKCCVIIENMCKLVNDPREVAPLLQIQPTLMMKTEGISDPEARSVAERACKELAKVGGGTWGISPVVRQSHRTGCSSRWPPDRKGTSPSCSATATEVAVSRLQREARRWRERRPLEASGRQG